MVVYSNEECANENIRAQELYIVLWFYQFETDSSEIFKMWVSKDWRSDSIRWSSTRDLGRIIACLESRNS